VHENEGGRPTTDTKAVNPVTQSPSSPDPQSKAPLKPRFAELFRQEHDFVWRCLRRLGFHEHEADDLTQDVFLVVHRRLEDFDPSRSMRAWLYGIAKRVGRDYRRGNDRRARRLALISSTPTENPDLEADVARREAGELVRRFLESIDETSREIFVLSELEGFRGAEVAAALDLNINTVYSKLRRGRRRFERFVNEERLPQEKSR
jgi:RNA polymerase sigma-70 factor (ECF subfamily)